MVGQRDVKSHQLTCNIGRIMTVDHWTTLQIAMTILRGVYGGSVFSMLLDAVDGYACQVSTTQRVRYI